MRAKLKEEGRLLSEVEEVFPKFAMALEKDLIEVEECLYEAVMFAERSIIDVLGSVRGQLLEIILMIKNENFSDPDLTNVAELEERLYRVSRTMVDLTFKIARGVREQLVLDDISVEELKVAMHPRRKQSS